MQLRLLLIFTSALALASCQKDSIPGPAPIASFEVVGVVGVATADVVTVGTYSPIQVANTSVNAVNYQWTLGNDSTKTGLYPGLLRYPKAGTYTLTLTARSVDGQIATTTRRVRVLDRVVKQIVIVGTRFANTRHPRVFSAPAFRAVLRLAPNRQTFPIPTNPYASYDAPIIFLGPLLPNLTAAQLPYTLPVPGRLVLDYPALAAKDTREFGYIGVGYGLELYVQDGADTYLTSSTYQTFYLSQVGGISIQEDIAQNLFIVQYANIRLVCAYE